MNIHRAMSRVLGDAAATLVIVLDDRVIKLVFMLLEAFEGFCKLVFMLLNDMLDSHRPGRPGAIFMCPRTVRELSMQLVSILVAASVSAAAAAAVSNATLLAQGAATAGRGTISLMAAAGTSAAADAADVAAASLHDLVTPAADLFALRSWLPVLRELPEIQMVPIIFVGAVCAILGGAAVATVLKRVPEASSPDAAVMECGICYEVFEATGEKAPRILRCGHTFCHGCLVQMLHRAQMPAAGGKQGHKTVACGVSGDDGCAAREG
jgi:hypothetical protein